MFLNWENLAISHEAKFSPQSLVQPPKPQHSVVGIEVEGALGQTHGCTLQKIKRECRPCKECCTSYDGNVHDGGETPPVCDAGIAVNQYTTA